jgi:amino acid transporter
MNNWGANNVASLLGVPQAHLLPAGVVTTYTVTLLPAGFSWLQILNGVLVGIVLLKDIPAFFLVSSRLIFAWSFDRFFPELFARVNSTFNSPHWAIILTMCGGLLGVVLNIFSGEWLASVDTTMLYQVAVMVGGLSAAVLPFMRSDIYEKSTAKYAIGGVPLITIIGVFAFTTNFYFLIVAGTWLNPMSDLVLQTVWMGLGASIFVGYMVKNVKKGIDVKTIYTEIPPA